MAVSAAGVAMLRRRWSREGLVTMERTDTCDELGDPDGRGDNA